MTDRHERPEDAPEPIDENPGSYLSELGTTSASVVWGTTNCLAILAVGFLAHRGQIGPDSEWFTLGRLAWMILPLSSTILGIVTLWQLGIGYTRKSPAKTLLSLGTCAAGLLLWAYFRFQLGVLPASAL